MSLGGACASPREVSFGGQKGAAVAKYGERGVVAWSRCVESCVESCVGVGVPAKAWHLGWDFGLHVHAAFPLPIGSLANP